MLCDGLKINEYEAYWLTDFPVINIWVHARLCGAAKDSLVTVALIPGLLPEYWQSQTGTLTLFSWRNKEHLISFFIDII